MLLLVVTVPAAHCATDPGVPTYGGYLRQSAIDRVALGVFLDADAGAWAQFDPEWGYIPGNAMRATTRASTSPPRSTWNATSLATTVRPATTSSPSH